MTGREFGLFFAVRVVAYLPTALISAHIGGWW